MQQGPNVGEKKIMVIMGTCSSCLMMTNRECKKENLHQFRYFPEEKS